MGKRKNIYFKDDDIILKLETEPNAAELISGLLRDHYNQSLEFLQQKKADLQTEVKLVQMKMENILRIKNMNDRNIEQDNKFKEKQDKRKGIIDHVKQLFDKGKISVEEYSLLFEDGKINIIKAKKLI